MINVKDQVRQKLLTVADNVTDLYPNDWTHLPCIQYTEEANNVILRTENVEQLAYLRYRIDIWDKGSTSATALAVDEAVSPLGLVRFECEDSPAADASGWRHKIMRYECQIDVNTEETYWGNNQ